MPSTQVILRNANGDIVKQWSSDQGPIDIGRGPRADKTISECRDTGSFRAPNKTAVMSSKHAVLEWRGEAKDPWIADFNSTNGTWIESADGRLTALEPFRFVKLEDESIIQFGKTIASPDRSPVRPLRLMIEIIHDNLIPVRHKYGLTDEDVLLSDDPEEGSSSAEEEEVHTPSDNALPSENDRPSAKTVLDALFEHAPDHSHSTFDTSSAPLPEMRGSSSQASHAPSRGFDSIDAGPQKSAVPHLPSSSQFPQVTLPPASSVAHSTAKASEDKPYLHQSRATHGSSGDSTHKHDAPSKHIKDETVNQDLSETAEAGQSNQTCVEHDSRSTAEYDEEDCASETSRADAHTNDQGEHTEHPSQGQQEKAQAREAEERFKAAVDQAMAADFPDLAAMHDARLFAVVYHKLAEQEREMDATVAYRLKHDKELKRKVNLALQSPIPLLAAMYDAEAYHAVMYQLAQDDACYVAEYQAMTSSCQHSDSSSDENMDDEDELCNYSDGSSNNEDAAGEEESEGEHSACDEFGGSYDSFGRISGYKERFRRDCSALVERDYDCGWYDRNDDVDEPDEIDSLGGVDSVDEVGSSDDNDSFDDDVESIDNDDEDDEVDEVDQTDEADQSDPFDDFVDEADVIEQDRDLFGQERDQLDAFVDESEEHGGGHGQIDGEAVDDHAFGCVDAESNNAEVHADKVDNGQEAGDSNDERVCRDGIDHQADDSKARIHDQLQDDFEEWKHSPAEWHSCDFDAFGNVVDAELEDVMFTRGMSLPEEIQYQRAKRAALALAGDARLLGSPLHAALTKIGSCLPSSLNVATPAHHINRAHVTPTRASETFQTSDLDAIGGIIGSAGVNFDWTRHMTTTEQVSYYRAKRAAEVIARTPALRNSPLYAALTKIIPSQGLDVAKTAEAAKGETGEQVTTNDQHKRPAISPLAPRDSVSAASPQSPLLPALKRKIDEVEFDASEHVIEQPERKVAKREPGSSPRSRFGFISGVLSGALLGSIATVWSLSTLDSFLEDAIL